MAARSSSPPLLAAVVVAALALWLAAYAASSSARSRDVQILQVGLASCTPELLAEKRPVVLRERVVEPRDLLATIFRYQFLWSAEDPPAARSEPDARARFTVLHAGGDGWADLTHPGFPAAPVRIRLRTGTTLVVPPRWAYRAPDHCRRLRLYDAFHTLLQALSPTK